MDVEQECAVCFVELTKDNASALLGCGHNEFCASCVEKLEICPLCRTPIAREPPPLLLHFRFINGKRYDVTCHPDETLGEIGARWELGLPLIMTIGPSQPLSLDEPIRTLPVKDKQNVFVTLRMRFD